MKAHAFILKINNNGDILPYRFINGLTFKICIEIDESCVFNIFEISVQI